MSEFYKKTNWKGKVFYESVDAGLKRLQLLKDVRAGKISGEKMNQLSKTKPYKLFFKQLPSNGVVVETPKKENSQ